MGQGLKKSLLAFILLLRICAQAQSAFVLNEAIAALEGGSMLGGKPSISTHAEGRGWLCTLRPFEEQAHCVFKVHSPLGILTHVV